MIFHEAPHKLRTTLNDLTEAFGPDRRISLCREITKLHEEVIRCTLAEAVAYYEENSPKGEYVLVVAGTAPKTGAAVTLEDGVAQVLALKEQGHAPERRCQGSGGAYRTLQKRTVCRCSGPLMPKVLAFPKILPFQKFELANQNNRMVMWLFRLCQSFL